MIMLIASILATFPWAVQDMHDGKTGLAPVEYRSRGPHSFDVLHYDVALDLYPEAESLVGVVGILFESDELGLDQITLDLFALGVDSAWDSTGPLAFTQSDSTVDLELSSPLAPGASTTVWMAFSGQPAHSTWAGFFWNVHFGPCLTHITLGMEPASGRWVFPCWDDIYDKASIDTHITVADSLFAASCGGLTGVESIGGRSTYNWSHPQEISLYIWALAVSDFNVVDDTTYPWIKYYVQEELTGYVEQIFGNVDLMMDCFEDVYCGYPWGQNLGFPFVTANGILCEHNTLPFTVINYESYVAHELSHHWWGNLVTEEDWPEIWLSEGLASYSQAAWEEWQYGEDSYHDFMLETMQYYLGTGELIPIVPAEDYWSATVYDKGSCVVHMLRHVVGDDSFWAALQSYLVDNAYGSTTTEDFVESFEAEYGSDLGWFFDPWVYGPGYPDYELSWTSHQSGSVWDVDVTIEQVQTVGQIFTMPVDLMISGFSEESLVVMWNDQQLDTQSFTVPFQPASVELDPDDWILHANQVMGVEEPGAPPAGGVSVFPNPASGSISIGWLHHGHFTARIYDMAGRCVLQSEVSAASPLVDISELPPGNYGIMVESLAGESGATLLTVLGN